MSDSANECGNQHSLDHHACEIWGWGSKEEEG